MKIGNMPNVLFNKRIPYFLKSHDFLLDTLEKPYFVMRVVMVKTDRDSGQWPTIEIF